MVTLYSAQEQVRKLTDTATRESTQNKQNAYEHWLAAVALSTELLGPTNPQTSFCIFNAGEALIKVRKGEEAISILRPHLRTMERIHGKSHYAVEKLHQSLARAYKLIGLNVSQLTHWLAAAQSAEKRRGQLNSTALYCYHNAARTYLALGFYDQALPLLVSVLSNSLARGETQIRLAYIARDTANCLTLSGLYEDALPLWQFAINAFDGAPKEQWNVRRRAYDSMKETERLLEQRNACATTE